MILRIGGREWRGRAVDCPAAVSPRRVAAAVRESSSVGDAPAIAVECPQPTAVHEHVGCIAPDMGLRVRTALARAGRTRGLGTPVDDRIAALADGLAAPDSAAEDRRAARRRVAASGTDTDRLREQVAEERGRLAAAEESDGENSELEAATAALAEAETSAIAARQALERERTKARTARDRLAERRARADALANARRRARATLVERLTEPYRQALRGVPGTAPDEDPFEADPVTAALAIAQLAALEAPVVLACERFADASAAAACLESPVIRLRP